MPNEALRPGELLTEREIQELKEKVGGAEFVAVETDFGVAVFRALTRQENQRYNAFMYDPKERIKCAEYATRTTLLKPTLDVFDSWLEKKPAIADTCNNFVLTLSGVDPNPVQKKY